MQSLVLGAPRHEHTGKVVIFTQASGQWRPKAQVTGTQVGCGEHEGGRVSRGGEGGDGGVWDMLGEVLVCGEKQNPAQRGAPLPGLTG